MPVIMMVGANTRQLLADAARRAVDYLDGLQDRSVAAIAGAPERLSHALCEPFPDARADAADILAFLDDLGSPATVASAGGRYFGFVTGGAMPATLAANYLAGAWDQNCFSSISSPAVAAFEEAALRWVKEALGLPMSSEGALVTGATMANFTCLAAARNWALGQAGWDTDARGLFGAPELTVIVGGEAHASLFKVLSMLGLGRERVTVVPADTEGRMRCDRLPTIKGPTVVCIQAGNVNTGAFDPAGEIVEWAHAGGAWVHVDGAFGIWALASPAYAALAEGFVAADSWASDAHKWLNVPYDSGIAVVREPVTLARAMSINGSYLLESAHRDAMNFTPDSSRRARAIEVWAALKSLGRSAQAELVDRNCRLARRFEVGLRESGAEVLNEVVLNQVVVAFGDDDRTNRVLSMVQRSGECWCGGTTWRGRAAMRISVSSWATTDDDVERSLSAILKAHREICG